MGRSGHVVHFREIINARKPTIVFTKPERKMPLKIPRDRCDGVQHIEISTGTNFLKCLTGIAL
jgi:hypothetical protein